MMPFETAWNLLKAFPQSHTTVTPQGEDGPWETENVGTADPRALRMGLREAHARRPNVGGPEPVDVMGIDDVNAHADQLDLSNIPSGWHGGDHTVEDGNIYHEREPVHRTNPNGVRMFREPQQPHMPNALHPDVRTPQYDLDSMAARGEPMDDGAISAELSDPHRQSRLDRFHASNPPQGMPTLPERAQNWWGND